MICFPGGSHGTYYQKEETFHTEEEVENNGIDCTLPGIYDCMLQRSLAGLFLIGENKKNKKWKKDLKLKKLTIMKLTDPKDKTSGTGDHMFSLLLCCLCSSMKHVEATDDCRFLRLETTC